MEINTHNAEILLSAANKSHYPQDELPEIALAGRSNVGKSSFINTMLNRKNLARTSGKPGKTQLLNFFNIDDKMRFVDVPGYGYARVSKKEREKWGRMIEEYLTTREIFERLLVSLTFVMIRRLMMCRCTNFLSIMRFLSSSWRLKQTRFRVANGTSTNQLLKRN